MRSMAFDIKARAVLRHFYPIKTSGGRVYGCIAHGDLARRLMQYLETKGFPYEQWERLRAYRILDYISTHGIESVPWFEETPDQADVLDWISHPARWKFIDEVLEHDGPHGDFVRVVALAQEIEAHAMYNAVVEFLKDLTLPGVDA